jgi:hypothetical protein
MPSGQQLLCDYRAACREDGAFEDDGEATIWLKPLDRLKQECSDEDIIETYRLANMG